MPKTAFERTDWCKTHSLIPSDISSLLNNHIFSFPRYFEGAGPRPNERLVAGADSAVEGGGGGTFKVQVGFARDETLGRGDNFMGQSLENFQKRGAHSSLAFVTGDLTTKLLDPLDGMRAKSSLGLTMDHEATKHAVAEIEGARKVRTRNIKARAPADAFDMLLTMTAKKGVNVREASVILDMQRDFRAKWDQVSSQRPAIRDEVASSPVLKKAARKGKYTSCSLRF